MVQPHNLVALITIVALLVYLGTALNVAGVRRRHGVAPPAMTGAPEVERALRVQSNTLGATTSPPGSAWSGSSAACSTGSAT